MDKKENDYITLNDDNGVEHEFEIVDSIVTEDAEYFALLPTEEEEDDEGGLYIYKVVKEGDEEYLEPIEDDDEYENIAEAFMDRLEELYDFES